MRLLAIAIIATLLVGCEQNPPSPTIRIGVNPWPGYLFLHLAEERGYFTEEGVAVELVELASSGDVALAYQRGQIDIGTSTTVDLVTTRHTSEKRPQVFFVNDFSNGADVILTRGGPTSMSDLQGKRVAAEVGALDMVHLVLALKASNMSMDDIVLVPMLQSDLPMAWKNGTIDAAVTYPPSSVELQSIGATRVFDTSLIPGTIIDLLMAESEFLALHKAECAAIVRAIERAVADLAHDRLAALEVMARRGGVCSESLSADLQGLSIPSLQQQIEMMQEGVTLQKSIEATIQALDLPHEMIEGKWFSIEILSAVQDG